MRRQIGFTCVFLMLFGGALALGGGAPAFAQGKKGWEVLVAYPFQPNMPKGLKQIALRPNAAQSVFLYLKNTELDEETNVEVLLVRGVAKGKMQLYHTLAKAKLNKDFRQPQLLTFEAEAEPAKKEGKGPPPPANDEGAPFHFQLTIAQAGKDPVTFELPVKVQQPYEYMEIATAQFDKKKSRLSARLKVKADSAEPPCPVALVLDPEVVPGAPSLLEYKLTGADPAVELKTENIQFVHGTPPQNGRVSLTVDGYKRAFMFKTTFDQGDLRPLEQTRARLMAPRYFNPRADDKPGPKGEVKPSPNIPIAIEADGTDAAKWIEVAFDLSGEGRFVRQHLLPGLREQAITFAVGQDGNPQFVTRVSDWKVDLDPKGVSGRRLVRVQVLDRKQDPLDLADEQNEKDEAVALFSRDPKRNPFAPLIYDRADKAVSAEIVVDPTPPAGVEFVDLPKKAAPGAKLRLTAKAKERDKVEQAPISKVQFLVGEAPKEPALSLSLTPRAGFGEADIPVPADAKEKLPVAVRFTTATGLSASDTGVVALQAAADTGSEKSKITGLVKRDERIQPERSVTLSLLGKPKVLMSTKTDDKGVYLFVNVPPGKYQVLATVPGYSKGIATATVTKDTGETIKADINMK